jgi:hypothetical protein
MTEEFTLVLSEKEVFILGKALSELPFKESAVVITKLQQQINKQQKLEENKET